MKAVKVFLFDGGRSGHIQVDQEGVLLPFYCYSGENVARTNLDVSFKRDSGANTLMKGIARQAIHDYRENKEKGEVSFTVETQGNKSVLKKEVPVVEVPTEKVEESDTNSGAGNPDADNTGANNTGTDNAGAANTAAGETPKA